MGGKIKNGIIITNALNFPHDYIGYNAIGFIHYDKEWEALMPIFLEIHKRFDVNFCICSSYVIINHTGLKIHTEDLITIAFSTIIKYLREEKNITPDAFTYKEQYV